MLSIIAGAGAIVLGSLLPWASLRGGGLATSVYGVSGDGAFTLVFGLIIGAVAVLAHRRDEAKSWQLRLMMLLSLVVLVVAISDLSAVRDVGGVSEAEGVTASVGIGLYIVLVGSAVAVVSAYVQMSNLRKAV